MTTEFTYSEMNRCVIATRVGERGRLAGCLVTAQTLANNPDAAMRIIERLKMQEPHEIFEFFR